MAANPVLLCIHRDPDRMRVLQENGYELLTAATGQEALGVLGTRPVDAIVLEYNDGLCDGSAVASEIKQVRPNMPIIMLLSPGKCRCQLLTPWMRWCPDLSLRTSSGLSTSCSV